MDHPRIKHAHLSAGTTVDALLAAIRALIAVWALLVFALLLHGALKSGA